MRYKKTIIAVLSLLGFMGSVVIIFNYSDYTVRAQVSEGIILAEGIKSVLAECYEKNGVFLSDNISAGRPSEITGKYTSSTKISNNTIVATFGLHAHKSIKNKQVKLIARQGANKVIYYGLVLLLVINKMPLFHVEFSCIIFILTAYLKKTSSILTLKNPQI